MFKVFKMESPPASGKQRSRCYEASKRNIEHTLSSKRRGGDASGPSSPPISSTASLLYSTSRASPAPLSNTRLENKPFETEDGRPIAATFAAEEHGTMADRRPEHGKS